MRRAAKITAATAVGLVALAFAPTGIFIAVHEGQRFTRWLRTRP